MEGSHTSAGSEGEQLETKFENEENSEETRKPSTRTRSEEGTAARILKDKNSEVTMVQISTDRLTSTPESSPESTPESTRESTPESTPESSPESSPESTPESSPESIPESTPKSSPGAEGDKELRLFVTLLTARVLKKCRALEKRQQEEWVGHIKRLVDQTMEGLSVNGDLSTDLKTVKKVCKSVLKDLKEKFCGQLETVILLQDPVVDAVIVRSFQTHIKGLPAQFVKKAVSRKWWREILEGVAFAVAIVATLIIMLAIP